MIRGPKFRPLEIRDANATTGGAVRARRWASEVPAKETGLKLVVRQGARQLSGETVKVACQSLSAGLWVLLPPAARARGWSHLKQLPQT